MWNVFKVNIVLVSLLLTLNIFYTLFYCFYCWLWTCWDCTVSRLIAAGSLALRREPTYDFRHSGRLWVALISSSFGKVVWFYTPRTSRRLSLQFTNVSCERIGLARLRLRRSRYFSGKYFWNNLEVLRNDYLQSLNEIDCDCHRLLTTHR